MADKIPTAHFEELEQLESWYWWHQTRFRIACMLLPKTSDIRLADVGCGMGGFLAHLHEHGTEGTGIDSSPSAEAALARKGIPYLACDLETCNILPGHPWDALSCLDVVEHIADDERFLSVLHSSLSPGGHLVLTVPSSPALFSNWDVELGHHRRYTSCMLGDRLKNAGFEVLCIRQIFAWAWLPGILKRKGSSLATGFPSVTGYENKFLLSASLFDYKLNRFIPFCRGTSIVALARRAQ